MRRRIVRTPKYFMRHEYSGNSRGLLASSREKCLNLILRARRQRRTRSWGGRRSPTGCRGRCRRCACGCGCRCCCCCGWCCARGCGCRCRCGGRRRDCNCRCSCLAHRWRSGRRGGWTRASPVTEDFHQGRWNASAVIAACQPDASRTISVGWEVAPRGRKRWNRRVYRPAVADRVVSIHFV
jgi:hypothetical protein